MTPQTSPVTPAGASPRPPGIVWRLTALLLLAFAVLTAADILITLFALEWLAVVETNPHAASGDDLRVGFLLASNALILLPLVAAFAIGATQAERVPPTVLARWWAHVLDVFRVNPFTTEGRARSPLRLITATMTILVLKIVIVASNVLIVTGQPDPISFLSRLWTDIGLSGGARYWASHGLLIIPCYVIGVAWAAGTLRLVQRRRRTATA